MYRFQFFKIQTLFIKINIKNMKSDFISNIIISFKKSQLHYYFYY